MNHSSFVFSNFNLKISRSFDEHFMYAYNINFLLALIICNNVKLLNVLSQLGRYCRTYQPCRHRGRCVDDCSQKEYKCHPPCKHPFIGENCEKKIGMNNFSVQNLCDHLVDKHYTAYTHVSFCCKFCSCYPLIHSLWYLYKFWMRYIFPNIILVAGSWSKWNPWTSCSLTCGDGTQSRDRSCTNPSPQHGGANCTGTIESSRSCKMEECPGEE